MKNIPKICHFCWTKGSPLSKLQYLSVISFNKYNPDWDIVIHVSTQTSAQLGENTFVSDYTGTDWFPKLKKLPYVFLHYVDLQEIGIGLDKYGVLVSDILRVKYLYEQGGVYSDFDMLWLKPMTSFEYIKCKGNVKDFDATVCIYDKRRGYFHHNASNIVAKKGSLLLGAWLKEQAKITPPYTHQAFNSELLNKMLPSIEEVFTKFPNSLLIDYDTFYPYSIYELNKLYIQDNITCITGNVMGVHWFNGHGLSHSYVQQNQKRFLQKCSMTSLLIKEGYEYE